MNKWGHRINFFQLSDVCVCNVYAIILYILSSSIDTDWRTLFYHVKLLTVTIIIQQQNCSGIKE